MMAGYLKRLEDGLREAGVACPLLLMMSSGGVTTYPMEDPSPGAPPPE